MPAQTSMLHVRVDETIKAQATDALEAMGLTMADAVRLLLHQVVATQSLPLELKVPNAETRAAIKASRAAMKARRARFATSDALFDDLEKKRRK